jgi:hypothetical protein
MIIIMSSVAEDVAKDAARQETLFPVSCISE